MGKYSFILTDKYKKDILFVNDNRPLQKSIAG